MPIIKFMNREQEQKGFDRLVLTEEKFSYIGDMNVEISNNQMNWLIINKVDYEVVEN